MKDKKKQRKMEKERKKLKRKVESSLVFIPQISCLVDPLP